MYPSSVEVIVVVWLRAYPSVVRWCLREEFGTPLLYKSSLMEVPSVGVLGGQVSGLEILLGEGGDVELGARISKHIFVFAFDPLSLNSLFTFVHCIIHIAISFISFILLVLCLALFHIAYILCLVVCVPHLYLTNESFI